MLRPTFAILLSLTSFCHADEVRWINAAGGSFSDGANWDTGQVPAATDTAIFDMPGTYTVTLATNQKVGEVITSAGAITLDLNGHILTSNITSSAGMLWVTGGSVSGSARAAGGRLVVEQSANFDRGGSASDAGVIIIRGHVGKAGDGFGGFTVASGSQLRLEGGSISTRAFSVFGEAEIIGGSILAETANIAGVFNMDGGTLDGAFGQDFWAGSTSRLFNGAVVRCSDTGAAFDGTVTIEGAGTRVTTTRVAGNVTVRNGGAVVRESGEFKISQNGRLVVGRGGSVEGRFYRMDQGVLRLEAGANPVTGLESFSMFPNVGLEMVIDGSLSNPVPHQMYSFFTELAGSIRLIVINSNGLAMGEEVRLLTATDPTITGSFSSVVVPSLPGGRTLAVEARSTEVLARVVSGGTSPCWGSDFNGDGDESTDGDIEAFFECIAGRCCATCGSADFNSDGDAATDADIEAFFRVLAGHPC